tara:strand:- start:81822 stop:82595 length:774 start_codon:yes stop_codon:yes gene_type:complete
MKKNSMYVACFFLYASGMQAQDFFNKEVKGKVMSADGDVAATHVLNISTEKAAITDIDGFFTIAAGLNDTLVFSAIQYKKKEIIITTEILASKIIYINLEPAVNELNEVVVMPYNLTGELSRDMSKMQVGPVVTASTLGLPNAYVKKMTQAERQLYSSKAGGPLISLLNALNGKTKQLKVAAERQKKYTTTERIRRLYHDSLYVKQLKVPKIKIDDFMYFCEVDTAFSKVVATHNQLKIWEFMLHKSETYRKNNELD